MHINLIIGAIFILALWWLLRETRARKKEQKAEPAAMLKDELEKRRVGQEKSRRAAERLASLKKQRMLPVLEGVREMIAALSGEERSRGAMSAVENGPAVVLALKYRGKEEAFILEWDVKYFDLELFSSQSSLANVTGNYSIRLPDGSVAREEEFSPFMRTLSGLIADRFA